MAWNKPSNGEAASSPLRGKGGASVLKRRGRRFPVRITGAVVVLGAGIAAWWLWPNGESAGETPSPRTRQQIKEVTPAAAPKARTDANAADSKPVVRDGEGYYNEKGQYVDAKGRVRLSIVTNNTGAIISIYQRPDGSKVEVFDHIRPKVPQTAADQLLTMILANERGGPPVPIRPGDKTMEEVFKKSLEKPLVAQPGDSDSIRALKERIMAAREEMATAMNETGKSFADIILEHEENTRENTRLLDDCQRVINECLKAGDKDGAATIYQKFQPQFEQLGVSGLTLDPEPEEDDTGDSMEVKQ